MHLLVRHRRGHDFTIYTHEHFRLPELFYKLFREVVRQVGEIILAESDDTVSAGTRLFTISNKEAPQNEAYYKHISPEIVCSC